MKRAERNLILYNTVRDIYTVLRDIEQQETLSVEANFVARVDALDRLSFHILERIENVQYVHGYHEELARLYHRGERLWQRLESVNTQFFHRLREQLALVHGQQTARLELARSAEVPTLLVRRGLRPGGLAPQKSMTRFTWTLGPSES